MPTAVQHLENDHLRADFFDDASAQILDKATGQIWHMLGSTWQDTSTITEEVVWNRRERVWADYFRTHFQVFPDGDRLRVHMAGPPYRGKDERARFWIRWNLDGRRLGLEVMDVDDRLQSLNFPPPIVSAHIVQPDGVGRIYSEASDGMNAFFSTQNNGLNQRWIGGLAADERAGWMMLFEDGYEDSGTYRTSLSVMPCFLRTRKVWAPRRSLSYHFVSGGYVDMAKTMRRYLLDHKLMRLLPEKIAETPDLKRLLGGRIVSTMQSWTEHPDNIRAFLRHAEGEDRLKVNVSHADMAEAMRLAKKWGMEKGLFSLRGTYNGGYDESHPDIWPPEAALGSLDELKKLFDHGDAPFMTVLHDNYQDIYDHCPSFPDGVLTTSDQRLLHGGFWHGGLTYILCSSQQRRYAERNWPQQFGALNMRGHFIDTCSCVQFYECYHPDHPTCRADERSNKIALMQFFKDQGIVLGSEEAADFGLWHIDWLENRHEHIPGGSTPPLWPLVFHDSAFYCRYPSEGTSGGEAAIDLANYLWGYMAYYPVNNLADWRGREAEFKASLDLDALHKRIGMDEMLDHQYLCEDKLVEKTEFASGVCVYANFASDARQVDDQTIPAQDKLIVE
jgi:hypothetical protein